MSRLAEGGRAMAPRTPPLAERLAEPWEGVKYTHSVARRARAPLSYLVFCGAPLSIYTIYSPPRPAVAAPPRPRAPRARSALTIIANG